MVNYNKVCKIIKTDASGNVDVLVQNYINSLDSTKVFAFSVTKTEADNVIVVIIHDA